MSLYRKLTREEASVVLHNARVNLTTHPSLRLGQSIHIVCVEGNYGHIERALTGTNADLFHIEDSGKVGELFYRYWVESEDSVESGEFVKETTAMYVECSDGEDEYFVEVDLQEVENTYKALENLLEALDNAGISDDNLTLPNVKKAIQQAKELL